MNPQSQHIQQREIADCNNVTHPAWQNKSAHSTAVDVDTGAPLRASPNGSPPSCTPCRDIRVDLTREQSKIVPLFIRNRSSKNPLADLTGVVAVLTLLV